ncbi:YhgE/Pip domain-containing protein [Gordonia sp. (in: high G+C Gram-positive bacteria)]|uniref:YhgE/Pip family protein n=1 Tax=Gordonia sp. (in: high G+C Gram-positive bacteria) TaxID=84139 RepID=UPI001699A38C|nr:YhgE/Pip domain-containing protein [Gordonia sp. (in: high G+C Gram-positive bacteria)]NLG47217.1 YhgE/Pip domain-containing protein [Gordonia sp. (in: high G+C Gram-positive bacteria)]
MLAAFSPGSDFKRYYRGRMPRLALAVIILMPLMYGALYLWAFWNPFNAVNKIPVALVNMDTGSEVMGKPLHAGDQVVEGLVDSKQLDLDVVSDAEAKKGVADGKYYFSITLPADFSEKVTSPTSPKPESAELIFTYNDANNYLATVMGQDAAAQVITQVSAQVGAQTFEIVLNDAGSMVGQLNQAASGADELSAGLVTAQAGSEQLSTAIDELSGVVMKATDPLLAMTANQQGMSAAELAATSDRISRTAAGLSTISGGAAASESRAAQAMTGIVAQLKRHPDPTVRAAGNALEGVQQQLRSPNSGVPQSGQLQQLSTDSAAISRELANPNSPLRQAMTLLEPGVLHQDIMTARAGAEELSSGADQLTAGLTELSGGAKELAAGLDAGVKAIPSWTDAQKTELANTLGQPVKLTENTEHEAATFGTGFAPFFFSLALFVGGIIAWMLFTPIQSRPVAQGLSSLRVVLASYAPTFLVGALQAAILYLVVVFAIGMRPEYPVATFGFMLLIVAMFLAMIQMFNALFGPAVGRVVTLAFLMIQLTSAGGIYPVPTTTLPFQYIHWVDPMTYTVNGLRQLTLGGIDYRLWVAIAVVAGLTIAFLAVSTWAARRNRQYTMDRLYPPVEV